MSQIKKRNEPEQICTAGTQREAIGKAMATESDWVLQYMLEIAKLIRRKILERKKWKFKGSFQSFTYPPLLTTLMKWIMIGAKDNIDNENRRAGVDRSISVATQLILQSTKTKRQVRYIPTSDNTEMSSVIETPLNVGLGMFVHQKTRSKELVETLAVESVYQLR